MYICCGLVEEEEFGLRCAERGRREPSGGVEVWGRESWGRMHGGMGVGVKQGASTMWIS
jgi:hypothetical protein